MALWGNSDSIHSPGTVTVRYSDGRITGSGTSFTAVGVTTGAVITIGAGGTFGEGVINSVTNDTELYIATTRYLSGATIAGATYAISEKPKFTMFDSNYAGITTTSAGKSAKVYGIDEFEAQTQAETPGTQYKLSHSGWVGIQTYMDADGNLRVKSEVLVAMSGITSNTAATYSTPGDADDDTVFPDRLIVISSQPTPVGIATTGTGTFSVTAAAVPTSALTYQWQVSANSGTSYSNATGGIYSGGTTTTLTLTNPTLSINNNLYRVVIASAGGATATSSSAKLTVTA
jgi:hypothetical protein